MKFSCLSVNLLLCGILSGLVVVGDIMFGEPGPRTACLAVQAVVAFLLLASHDSNRKCGQFEKEVGSTQDSIAREMATLGKQPDGESQKQQAKKDSKVFGKTVFSKDESVLVAFNDDFIVDVRLGVDVQIIGVAAFSRRFKMISLALPDGLTKIDDFAFSHCVSLRRVAIPETVTEIGDAAFAGCRSLKFIAIPNGVTEIPDCAFSHCSSLTTVTLPEGLTKIGAFAFSECKSLKSITLPSTVTTIDERAFPPTTKIVRPEV